MVITVTNLKTEIMKKVMIVLMGIFFVLAVFPIQAVKAQGKEIKIQTTAQCGMCKERIETAMAFEKGVKSSSLDLETKILTVVIQDGKTRGDKVRMAVTKLGYDADGFKKDEKAYKNLPGCCKLPDDPDHVKH